jgi:hypothetical protein
MPTQIYRYEVPVNGDVKELELRGRVLSAQMEYWDSAMTDGEPRIIFWALHHDEAEAITRRFMAIGTGWALPENAWHLGTAPRGSDDLVWHLVEVTDPVIPEPPVTPAVSDDVTVTEIKIYRDPQERIEDAISINGSWVNNADYEEVRNIRDRLTDLASEMKFRHEQTLKGDG